MLASKLYVFHALLLCSSGTIHRNGEKGSPAEPLQLGHLRKNRYHDIGM